MERQTGRLTDIQINVGHCIVKEAVYFGFLSVMCPPHTHTYTHTHTHIYTTNIHIKIKSFVFIKMQDICIQCLVTIINRYHWVDGRVGEYVG